MQNKLLDGSGVDFWQMIGRQMLTLIRTVFRSYLIDCHPIFKNNHGLGRLWVNLLSARLPKCELRSLYKKQNNNSKTGLTLEKYEVSIC